ncbi:hypothetical protein KQX54_016199, partial [Cotesia glomerata]
MVTFIRIDVRKIEVTYVKKLLKKRPDFNISDIFIHLITSPKSRLESEYENTLLHHAINTRNEELLDYLISLNVDLNVTTTFEGTALHRAIELRNFKFIRKLIKAGADVNVRMPCVFLTPLVLATIFNNLKIAEYLIKNGADIHAVTNFDQCSHTALVIATYSGFYNIADVLLKNGAIPCGEINLSNLNIENVKKILRATPNININTIFICRESEYYDPTTLTHLAVQSKNQELLDYLIDADADININIPRHGTVLHVAAKMGDLDLVEKLCESGADVNVQIPEWNRTPLIEAVTGGFFEVAEYLIENNADVNATSFISLLHNYDGDSGTALLVAVIKGFRGIVELLLKNNADPNAESKFGWTPVLRACIGKDLDLIYRLMLYGGIFDDRALRKAVINKNIKVLRYLLFLDIDTINSYLMSKKSKSPILHYIFKEQSIRIYVGSDYQRHISFLLEAGADVNSVNYKNELAVEITDDSVYLDYIKSHIVRLKQADMYVCQKNLEAVKNRFDNFHTECLREVQKLKNDKIGSSNLSFYTLLHKSSHFCWIRLKNFHIDTISCGKKLFDEYPNYA